MPKIVRWQLLLLALLLGPLFGKEARATTYTAASCAESDVSTALAKAASGDTVQLPACLSGVAWTSTLNYTAPGSVTIIGAGNQSTVGGGDQTVIIDNVSHTPTDNAMWAINTGAAGTVLRLSGITIRGGSGGVTFNGSLRISGPQGANIRVDHLHFYHINAVAGFFADVYGVMDHCLFDMVANSTNNGIRVSHLTWGGHDFGDGSWADSTTFGSNRFMFFEDNIFNNGFVDDLNAGGRLVFRHNTLNHSAFQNHEMEIRMQGGRAFEFYANNLTCDPNLVACGATALFLRTGTGLIWGNTALNPKNWIQAHDDRSEVTISHGFSAPPNGFGECGTLHGPSVWDQNTNSSGYACFNQIGRGKGDLLANDFPFAIDTATGTATWPNEALEPIYQWDDNVTLAPTWGGTMFAVDAGSIVQNRDYYLQVGGIQTNATTPFNGTVGTGFGTLANRPTTCSPLVAYWATDTNTLYQCATTNTWTAYYTPYTYPHPLTLSSGTPPASPTNLGAVVQ